MINYMFSECIMKCIVLVVIYLSYAQPQNQCKFFLYIVYIPFEIATTLFLFSQKVKNINQFAISLTKYNITLVPIKTI